MSAALLVIAKAPRPGRSKTRLTPPCTPEEAAGLAEAALTDTLRAVAAVDARRVLVLDGEPGPWLPRGAFEVLPQRGDGLDERLAAAFGDAGGGPAFLVGMDTPQLTPALLRAGLGALAGHDAALGMAEDGGYWGIGLRDPAPEDLLGVPMSADDTGAEQLRRLRERGRGVAELPPLRDVDRIEDARAVAALAPGTAFAARLAEVEQRLAAEVPA